MYQKTNFKGDRLAQLVSGAYNTKVAGSITAWATVDCTLLKTNKNKTKQPTSLIKMKTFTLKPSDAVFHLSNWKVGAFYVLFYFNNI